jgi:Leucine-rich repeat (LRR) protein
MRIVSLCANQSACNSYNKFTGSIPPLEAGFAKTLEISLAHNLLTGPLPNLDASAIAELLATLRVSKLDISSNFLTGTVNPAVSFLSTLKSFNASYNKFVDEFPTAGGWPSIEILSASNNLFTGTISTVWPQGLRHFDMSGNKLNGFLPTELCKLSSLEFLLLSSNSLEGSIPSCYTGMSSLRAMEIASARLVGPIPDSIDQLRYLNVLDISKNTLTGKIPTTMGLMSKLNQLSVDNNSLSSVLPSALGSLSLLYKLHLSNNDFVGTIPTSLGGLTGLESITLVGNELSGAIPNEWCQLSTIKLSARDVGCDLNCPCCFDSSEVCG